MYFSALEKQITNIYVIANSGVCVNSCPTSPDENFEHGKNCIDNGKIKCSDVTKTQATSNFGHYCIPEQPNTAQKKAMNDILKSINQSKTGGSIIDIYQSKNSLMIGMATAFVFSLVYILIMSKFAEKLAQCTIVLTQLGLISLAAFAYFLIKDQ